MLNILISITIGLIAGLSTVYTFNRIPARWLCDYDQEPEPGMWGERISNKPWTVVFTLFFIACSLKLLDQGILFIIPAIIAIWLLVQIAMADKKYMIIPDQFVIALAVVALGFIPFHASYLTLLQGALVGGGSILIIGIIGRLIFRKEAMGFGDVKLFAAIGLLCGLEGTIIVFMITIFSSAFIFGIGLLTGKIKAGDEQPLGPFIAAAATLYLLFHIGM